MFWNELYLSPILNREGQLTHFVGVQNDVTAQIEAARRLEYMARHDALTGLVNRRELLSRLQQALARDERSQRLVAVLFMDLNNFKQINDIFGHDAGDTLLTVVADRLRAASREGDTLARLGGDEFVVVLEDPGSEAEAIETMQRLLASVQEPIEVLGCPVRTSASAGLALYPRDGKTADALLRAADLNMYAAKHTNAAAR
jgi:diguanylate cyclase (GGDEF)-like protein